MAKSKKNNNENEANLSEGKANKYTLLIGSFLVLFGLASGVAFVSYLFTGTADQSSVDVWTERSADAQNELGKLGMLWAYFCMEKGFGLAALIGVKIWVTSGLYLLLKLPLRKLYNIVFWDLYTLLLLGIALGLLPLQWPGVTGMVGYEIQVWLQHYLGLTGTVFTLLMGVVVYLVFKVRIHPDQVAAWLTPSPAKSSESADLAATDTADMSYVLEEYAVDDVTPAVTASSKVPFSVTDATATGSASESETDPEWEPEISVKPTSFNLDPTPIPAPPSPRIETAHEEAFVIEEPEEEEQLVENTAARLVADFGEFDPTLELSQYQFPTIDLLKDYPTTGITINQEELEENKNRIVETLRNYKIDIAQIKATVGPSVTLYEIVPEAGIRILKIKSLEDDIALSLSALGIRIIAPMPGKGTIGIEVPNKNPTVVPMRGVIASARFQEAEMELPIALGKTISNETFVVDLAKMPHLLMAGATGQGKSVGLNAVLTSLLYKKHPAEVKFVLVDPKKVELTLFTKIERHYLAKLPDAGEAIITDNSKVINTLNSLCIEMDNRYNLLKDAMVRNIKEYNDKFRNRKLNPELGHRYLPYIVLVVDEFADLIMTAGKEVETPIARLAQLARAIGIHLIIATQRPSVNVITGIIKANFPARIAFRVSSKIDSRTILDAQGAEQLIGRGDLLYSNGNDLTRVQCAFVDTPEVEKITAFIGNQRAYPSAYLLPEYQGEGSDGPTLEFDPSERDPMFREAAEVIVTAQQGSASLLQRKLKLGYNRAGRLIDQLEAAGIVGPFEGSKARSVNFPDLTSLDAFLNQENQ